MVFTHRPFVRLLVIGCIALIASAGSVRADFIMHVYEDGVDTGVSFDVATGTPIVKAVQASDFAISVNATSNSPGDQFGAQIQTIAIVAHNLGAGAHTLSIAISDVGFNTPTTPIQILKNSVSLTWGNDGFTLDDHTPVASGGTNVLDTVTGTSYVNTANKQFGSNETPPAFVQIGDNASTTATLPVILISDGVKGDVDSKKTTVAFAGGQPFSLTNVMSEFFQAGDGAQITATADVVASPAPSNVIMLAFSLPLLGLGGLAIRRRRQLATAV